MLPGGHLVPGLETKDLHFACAGSQGRSGDVDCDVSSADNHYVPPIQADGFSLVDIRQEIDAVESFEPLFFPRYAQFGVAPQSEGQQHRIVALFKGLDANLGAKGAVEVHRDARTTVQDPCDIGLYEPAGQAKRWNSPGYHAAQASMFFINIDCIARFGQVLGGGQSRRTRSDNCDCFGLCNRKRLEAMPLSDLLRDEAFEIANRYGPVALSPSALRFTGLCADPPADRRERIACRNDFECSLEILLCNKAHIGWNIRSQRAALAAGRGNVVGIEILVVRIGWRYGSDVQFTHFAFSLIKRPMGRVKIRDPGKRCIALVDRLVTLARQSSLVTSFHGFSHGSSGRKATV